MIVRLRQHLAALALGVMVAAALAIPARASDDSLVGHWVLNDSLTQALQPDGPSRGGLSSNLPRPSISVSGIPLPDTGSALPSISGNARDPRVLRCSALSVERLGDDLHLSFGAVGSDTLKRGNDQGLVSRWNDRKLTSRYETTSRKVTQVFEVQRDGHLLVTVTLNPRDGAKVVHKRVFDRAGAADSASSAPR